MVSNSIIIGIGVSIALMVVSIIIAIVKYRKKEFVASAIIWGIVSFLVYNALSYLFGYFLFSVLFKDASAYEAFLNGNNTIMQLLYATLYASVPFVATVILITVIQHKRNKVNEFTGEMTGTGMGLFSWINPSQGTLLPLINFFMYSFAINAGGDALQPTETITQEQIDGIVDLIVNSSFDVYLRPALLAIALLLLYRAVFKAMDGTFKQASKSKMALAGGMFFVSYLLLQVFTFDSLWYGFAFVGFALIGIAVTFIVDRTPVFKA